MEGTTAEANPYRERSPVMTSLRTWALLIGVGIAVMGLRSVARTPAQDEQGAARRVDFSRDIRPILSDKCYACHGPDEATRKTKLRFDTKQGAFQDLGGYRAIVPGKPAESPMVRRITAEEEAFRMPPPYSDRKLTKKEIELIRLWIEQGARWQTHWAFIPPRRPELPQVANRAWPKNGMDSFILHRLQKEGLAPSPEATRAKLIRRVTHDLTGLPPTPEELDLFLADTSPQAYEKVVDRLLASPRYGERMAAWWLDAARYADTNGYQTDGDRIMWRWRDWVIEAFNRNLPFDQFTLEQLAGDMLPEATLDQKIATGFSRNHRGNGEGGIIAEEYAVEYVVDRVNTTSTVWLGVTLGCARCHDHKYDPVTQKEFYRVFALFNNVPENGKAFKYGNSPPIIKAPTRQQQAELEELDRKLSAAELHLARLNPEVEASQASWEKSLKGTPPIHWAPSRGLAAYFALDGTAAGQGSGAGGQANILESKFAAGEAAFAGGRIGQAASFDGTRFLNAGDVGGFTFYDKFSGGAWIYPEGTQGGAILSRSEEIEQGKGYSLSLVAGKVQLNLVVRWLDDAIRVETESALASGRWHHVLFTYDGSRLAAGIKIYVNGKPAKLEVLLDQMNQDFKTTEPFRVGSGGGPESRFQGLIDEVRVYQAALTADEVGWIATSTPIHAIAATAPDRRSQPEAGKIRAYYLEHPAPPNLRQAWQRVLHLRKERDKRIDHIPTTMVMQEMEPPRETFLLIRGSYDQPGERVSPGIPASLGIPATGPVKNRLDFARWLFHPSNPLTARVTVNRLWQMLFGTGLVRTVDDFGSQGEAPTHPELLDWLATEFMRNGWDLKALLKTVVMSATYRQSSRSSPGLVQKDPQNRLLARGPRFRLSAEMIRDQVLAASGLLVEKMGGPSVRPYQPAGLWKELTVDVNYQQDQGEALYRRSLYTFWKRTVPPPSMMTFDAAGRETCIVRETRTNTPLQALNLMNSVTYVEASRVLAQRILIEGRSSPEDRLALAFRLMTARRPTAREQQILLGSFQHHLATYRDDPEAAAKLLSEGEFPRDEGLDPSELAAYTTVVSLILNLDETITKE